MPQPMPNSGNGVENNRKPLSAGFGSYSQVRPHSVIAKSESKKPKYPCRIVLFYNIEEFTLWNAVYRLNGCFRANVVITRKPSFSSADLDPAKQEVYPPPSASG